ncbi:hypothetical protein [Pseudobacillus wudalianchiensis]|uniref:DUF3139 domain-containing protein n=1 Tax=Pseudobacillus wudalianchiensis TaxID=1743143 RepID=A0A1B9B8B4_9BACI|nr:hypothetical protein [Bacillus wudalianchiensis]OCA92320.1 hypothetical protein A8F95_00920 [Bacillus wudalianchiensis]
MIGPNGVVLFSILLVPVLILTGTALLWKKRRVLFLFITIVVVTAEVYYLIYKEKAALQEWYISKDRVHEYLTKKYPGADWVLMQDDSFLRSSKTVEVVFIDEPHVTYLYSVDNGKVSLTGGSVEEGYEMKRRDEE